jgi:hypothetical protein
VCPKCKIPQHGSNFAGNMHSFAGMVHNKDSTGNNDQNSTTQQDLQIFTNIYLMTKILSSACPCFISKAHQLIFLTKVF